MSEEEYWRFFQRMERKVYGKSSYLFAGETNLEPWEEEEEIEYVQEDDES
jgi:uncharacterized HAD superfamily protein